MYAQNTYFLNFIYKIQPITTIIVKKKKNSSQFKHFFNFLKLGHDVFFFPLLVVVQFGPRAISQVLEWTRSGSKLFWIPQDVRNLKTPILDPDSYPIVPSIFSKQVHESWTRIGSTGPESGPSGILRVKENKDKRPRHLSVHQKSYTIFFRSLN